MGRTRRRRKRKNVDFVGGDDLIELKKWMRVKNCHIRVKSFPLTGRGVLCKKRISIGDELISLPLHFLITPNVCTKTNLFHQSDITKLSPQLVLTIFLMYERHLSEKSEYSPYIKHLPNSYTTLFFCEKPEIDMLPCFMRTQITKKLEELEQEFDKMMITLSSVSCNHCEMDLRTILTKPNFNWAWFTVNTRSVYYKDEEYEGPALAPLLDMFNHSPEAEIEVVIDQPRKQYILKTLTPYQRNEEVFIKYGPHTNLKLLCEYGFVLENNPHDYIEFTFDEVINSIKEYKPELGIIRNDKYKFIMKNGLNKNLTKNREEFSWNVNALLYVLVTRDDHLPCVSAKCYSNDFSVEEWCEIDKIVEILKRTKKDELSGWLKKMDVIYHPSESFTTAKKLLEIYRSYLE